MRDDAQWSNDLDEPRDAIGQQIDPGEQPYELYDGKSVLTGLVWVALEKNAYTGSTNKVEYWALFTNFTIVSWTNPNSLPATWVIKQASAAPNNTCIGDLNGFKAFLNQYYAGQWQQILRAECTNV